MCSKILSLLISVFWNKAKLSSWNCIRCWCLARIRFRKWLIRSNVWKGSWDWLKKGIRGKDSWGLCLIRRLLIWITIGSSILHRFSLLRGKRYLVCWLEIHQTNCQRKASGPSKYSSHPLNITTTHRHQPKHLTFPWLLTTTQVTKWISSLKKKSIMNSTAIKQHILSMRKICSRWPSTWRKRRYI